MDSYVRFIVPYEGLNAPSDSFIISITMNFGLLYKIKMIIKVLPLIVGIIPTSQAQLGASFSTRFLVHEFLPLGP